jgi:hypothetical protein
MAISLGWMTCSQPDMSSTLTCSHERAAEDATCEPSGGTWQAAVPTHRMGQSDTSDIDTALALLLDARQDLADRIGALAVIGAARIIRREIPGAAYAGLTWSPERSRLHGARRNLLRRRRLLDPHP